MLTRCIARMSNSNLAATARVRAITRHMATSTGSTSRPKSVDEDPVLWVSNGSVKQYILNRPKKLNALDMKMLDLLRPGVEEWSKSELNKILVGTGQGRAFCAGGDVAGVVEAAESEETRPKAIEFFKREFELDYILATLTRPYVAIMEGVTMGGGAGLSVHAPFRIATENTVFAMPETKIGYCPDVGATYFLSHIDGEVGTYLGLTAEVLSGRAVFEHGLATHFIPSRRIPGLIERLADLQDPTYEKIDSIIEECSQERASDEPVSLLTGAIRAALDRAFGYNKVEKIFEELQTMANSHEDHAVREWAQKTLTSLELRSPTSLKVALKAIRGGKKMELREALQMEMNIATAFCNGDGPDFCTGVRAVLVEKIKERPTWTPPTLSEVDDKVIAQKFFGQYTPKNGTSAELDLPPSLNPRYPVMRFALPTETEIQAVVTGSDKTLSGGTAVTLEELLDKFESVRKGKIGVREKILEVVHRRCTQEEFGDAPGKKWLKWKH